MTPNALIEFVNWSRHQDELSAYQVSQVFKVANETAERWISALKACIDSDARTEGDGRDISPTPIRIRIIGALALQPMTNEDLARCLCVDVSSVRVQTSLARMNGTVKIISRLKAIAGRSKFVYALTELGHKTAFID